MKYLTLAWRNLMKYKGYSLIYIVGLAVGLGVVLLDGLWIHDELSFNKYHRNYDRIAQVMHHDTFNGERLTMPWFPYLMGDLLRNEFGGDFKQVVMSTGPGTHVLSWQGKNLNIRGGYMDRGAPSMLGLEMEKGSEDGLREPNSILLAASAARAIFENQNPIGKILMIDHAATVKVTGVYRDLPFNSDFKDQAFIAPWDLWVSQSGIKMDPSPWNNNSFLTYVQLAAEADPARVSAKIKNLKKDHLPPALAGLQSEVFLHPMSRWHLYSEFTDGVNTGGRIQYVRLFAIVGLFVLLQACINFVNLTTARAQNRAREIGIRKTIGSLRTQLMIQFFFESVLITLLSFMLAVVLVWIFLPLFNQLADKTLSIPWANPWFWLLSVAFAAFVGMMAGLYPAAYLSSLNPVKVLKGNFRAGRTAIFQRKALVVLQFTISVVFIIGTMVVFRQIQYGKDREIGYNPKDLITMPLTPDMYMHFSAFSQDLKKSGAALEVAESTNSTIETNVVSGGFDWEGKDPNISTSIPVSNVSSGYGKTIGWKLLEGRDFSPDFPADSSAFILNEAAVKFMGLKHPVGRTIRWKNNPFRVIGLIRDIVYESPYQSVQPYIYQMRADQGYILVTAKINTGIGVQKALDRIKAVYGKYNPNFPFEYRFTDLEYAGKFSEETRIGGLAGFFAGLAVFISGLGIFGLSAFVTRQRIKEIGIRKVLGSSPFALFALLVRGFNELVMLSFIIGGPVAYFLVQRWLRNYQYRAGVSWWIFLAAGAGLLAITWLSTSYHAVRATRINPVETLRSE
jgi:putative ABC transport system permease protein